MRASWGLAGLDRELVAGLPPDASEARLLGARRLMLPGERRGIAAVLENPLDAAGTGRGGKEQRGNAPAIRASRDQLVQPIARLRSDSPMSVRAVALAELLACDRSGPLRSGDGTAGLPLALDEIALTSGR